MPHGAVDDDRFVSQRVLKIGAVAIDAEQSCIGGDLHAKAAQATEIMIADIELKGLTCHGTIDHKPDTPTRNSQHFGKADAYPVTTPIYH
ncbi:MAG: hypothetical protein ACKVH7_11850, partial [Alphaproteobacteria bacterium]